MSDATRQAVLDQMGRKPRLCKIRQDGDQCASCDDKDEDALAVHEADERRRAVAALGCQCLLPGKDGEYLSCRKQHMYGENLEVLPLPRDRWCAPCRAQAELEVEADG